MSFRSLNSRLNKLFGKRSGDGRCPLCPERVPVRFVEDESELDGATLPKCEHCGWSQAADRKIYFIVIAGVEDEGVFGSGDDATSDTVLES